MPTRRTLIPRRCSTPRPSPTRMSSAAARRGAQGEIPSPLTPPSGCVFHTRCPIVGEECRREIPAVRDKLGRDTSWPVIKHDDREGSRRRRRPKSIGRMNTHDDDRSSASPERLPSRLAAGSTADAQQPKQGGTLQFAISAETPHYDCHGSDTYRDAAFRRAVLFDAAALQSRQVPRGGGRSRQFLDGRAGPDDLHVQAPSGREIPRRHDADARPTSRRPTTGCATRRRAWSRPARRPSPTSARSRRPIRSPSIFKMKAVNAAMLEHFASPWNVHLFGQGPRGRSERAEDQDQRHRAVHLRRARQGQPRLRQAQRELFQEGPALSRRLQGRVHAAGRRDAQRVAGRAGAGRIPRHLAGRARPPGAGDGRQDPHRGIELDAQPAGLPSTPRRSRSTTCACARRC